MHIMIFLMLKRWKWTSRQKICYKCAVSAEQLLEKTRFELKRCRRSFYWITNRNAGDWRPVGGSSPRDSRDRPSVGGAVQQRVRAGRGQLPAAGQLGDGAGQHTSAAASHRQNGGTCDTAQLLWWGWLMDCRNGRTVDKFNVLCSNCGAETIIFCLRLHLGPLF